MRRKVLTALSKIRRRGAPSSNWLSCASLTGVPTAGLAAGLLVLGLGAGVAGAQGSRDTRYDAYRRTATKPVMAIVALAEQRVSIYDAEGKFVEAPVSTGSAGYETPAGIFSIVQKKEDHRSNLYEDGEMPFMQRITWTGIALHAGNLPGHPASHGCVRMPMGFARQLFDMTEMGMRVLIVRDDMAPSDISHPALFEAKPVPRELALAAAKGARVASTAAESEIVPGSTRHLQTLQSIATAREAEVEPATRRQREAGKAAARAAAEMAGAARTVRSQEADLARAESALNDAERRLEAANTPQAKERAEAAKGKAQTRVGEVQTRLQAARLQEQARREAAERAEEESKAATAAKDRLAQAAEEAMRRTYPVSVLVSRKTQRLYVRKGNHPVYEGPAMISDAQAPIGTFVFTAVDLGASNEMRWTVVSMYRDPTRIGPATESHGKSRNARAAPTDVRAATAALDRIALTQEARDLISEVVLPGSSLIISDEGPSRETGKDTDFVVVMSNEPQGALKIRQREPRPVDQFDWPPWARGSRGGSPFPFWNW
jgi:L,D-transpeptidase catalytic domain